ncbi:TetR/AcrR family transcriptional regulator [Longimicrobium sp.]|uniref:TetR/AcrR family transcriptional regulator n=1 Tax=Longimicrobium sp. TaxID=2029185 RepID=UPI002E3345BE|nr:TetR/AcrR family transcriptional regulator [Longimicrobium sp.]HEX6037737.1 TetR/AcrR family transcriptional regulator [Longimicrobium sp.]
MEHERIESDRQGPGRPRSEEAHTAILTASIDLIRDVGYDAVTMEGIAARAGVGKATVYRRWKSREALVVEAIGRIVAAVPDPDTGSTRGDLLALMTATLRMYEDPASAALLSGLVAAMARSAPIADAVRTGFVGIREEAVRRVLRRGMARGDLRQDVDLELALHLLHGPMFYRFLITGGPVDAALATDCVDTVLRTFAPDGSAGEHSADGGRG